MRTTIEHRLSRLEVQHRPPDPPGDEPDGYEILASMFIVKELWFDADGMVCVGPVGLSGDQAWLREISALLNQDKGNAVIVPLPPPVALQATQALRSGRLRIEPIRGGNGQPTGHQRLGMGYTGQGWAYECNYLAHQVNLAIEACEAQGVTVEWTVDGLIEILSGVGYEGN